MKLTIILSLLLSLGTTLFSQKTDCTGTLHDAVTGESLIGVTISVPALQLGTTTDSNGQFKLILPLGDAITMVCSYVGYQTQTVRILPKNNMPPLDIQLNSDAALEEVTISTTRTNSRIEDLPVKVEVLGTEELEEEASLVPGGMGSLLGDLSVITIQRTGAVSGNDAVRMQGLAPGYTQLLQDGLPLYGGFSGSLGVLNIPPLDLRQVEIIKGSSSTLYGGGAIGGLINFLSKTPGKDPKSTLLLNQTTLGETDLNAFISRKVTASQGFTLLTAGSIKQARDVNKDGFAEVPQGNHLLVHPRWFWGIGKKTNADLGFTFAQNKLRAGDLMAIQEKKATTEHPFLQDETARRLLLSGQVSTPLSKSVRWTLRGAGSQFQRGGHYAGLDFGGRQYNTYLETNILWQKPKDDVVIGTNLTGEQFDLFRSSPAVSFSSFGYFTQGVFAQLDHRFSSKVVAQAGFRVDHHTRYGWFALPRISLLYKPVSAFSARLGYGRGYKTPDLFGAAEATDYIRLQPLAAGIQPDLANSLNADLNYQKLLFDVLSVQVNQALYYTDLAHPFESYSDAQGRIFLQNFAGTARVLGTDTYIQLKYKELETYIGYNHTLALRHATNGGSVKEPFNPQDKIALTVAWSIPEKWRFGIEAAYTGNQYVTNNRRVPSYWFLAAMAARHFHWGTVVLNCENVGDARQSRHESLVTGSTQRPVIQSIWGPVEGRVLNLSVKVNL